MKFVLGFFIFSTCKSHVITNPELPSICLFLFFDKNGLKNLFILALSNKNPFRTDWNKQQFLRENIGTRRFRIRENMAWARYFIFSQFSTLLQTVFKFRNAKRGVFCRHPIFVSRNLLWRNMWSTFTLSNFLPLQAWYVRTYYVVILLANFDFSSSCNVLDLYV